MSEWDLTKHKRASRKNRIVKCPVCGEYGQVIFFVYRRKPKSAGIIRHKGRTYYSSGMYERHTLDESCTITEAQAVEIEAWLANEEVA